MIYRTKRNDFTWLRIILALIVLFNIVNLAFHIESARTHGESYTAFVWLICGYVCLGIWGTWAVNRLYGRSVELTDSEIKQLNRSGKVIISRKFEDVAELKFGVSTDWPRALNIHFSDGKRILVGRSCENIEALSRLIEERTGKSFEEPIQGTKKRKTNVRIGE